MEWAFQGRSISGSSPAPSHLAENALHPLRPVEKHLAERALRLTVIARKVSFGLQLDTGPTRAGSRWRSYAPSRSARWMSSRASKEASTNSRQPSINTRPPCASPQTHLRLKDSDLRKIVVDTPGEPRYTHTNLAFTPHPSPQESRLGLFPGLDPCADDESDRGFLTLSIIGPHTPPTPPFALW